MSNIAGIYWDDTAAAPGISLSVYFSGCPLHCPGCHNPEAQNFNYGVPFTQELVEEIGKKMQKNGVARKLSILGGEPLCDENLHDVAGLISYVKALYPNTIIYIWSGYTREELLEREEHNPMLQHILELTNVLIDGPFIQEQRDTTLYLRGSSNQRIWYLNGEN